MNITPESINLFSLQSLTKELATIAKVILTQQFTDKSSPLLSNTLHLTLVPASLTAWSVS